jgi:hypothetical protein
MCDTITFGSNVEIAWAADIRSRAVQTSICPAISSLHSREHSDSTGATTSTRRGKSGHSGSDRNRARRAPDALATDDELGVGMPIDFRAALAGDPSEPTEGIVMILIGGNAAADLCSVELTATRTTCSNQSYQHGFALVIVPKF